LLVVRGIIGQRELKNNIAPHFFYPTGLPAGRCVVFAV
jgi:hypothetical protein